VASGSQTAAPSPAKSIRSLDFTRVTYPNFPVYTDDRGTVKRVTLQPGEAAPSFTSFGDITGDGEEEAVVVLGIQNRGSAISDYVYVFTLERGLPRIIWEFQTGDRADGGLRQVYAKDGELVVELFGKNRVVGGDLMLGDEPLCCPSSFTRAYYRMVNRVLKFQRSEVEPNPEKNANPVMKLTSP
jgi:hypothetical protein